MRRYIFKRILQIIPLLLISITINFALIRMAPGDPIQYLMSDAEAPAGYIKELREAHGLDQPLYIQYIKYMRKVITGDFGYSFFYNQPVLGIIISRMQSTLFLTITAFMMSLVFGVLFGVIASKNPYSLTDTGISVSSMIVWAMPSFWVAMLLIVLFAVVFPIFPIGGLQTPATGGDIYDILWHLVLPASALGLGGMAGYTRLIRANMLEEMDKDYIIYAWSKGLSENSVYFGHAFRNALLPIVTSVGLRLRFLFTGAALTEIVFAWPGIGRLLNESIFRRDYYMITCIFIMIAIVTMLSNLLADVLYAYVDPRISYQK